MNGVSVRFVRRLVVGKRFVEVDLDWHRWILGFGWTRVHEIDYLGMTFPVTLRLYLGPLRVMIRKPMNIEVES